MRESDHYSTMFKPTESTPRKGKAPAVCFLRLLVGFADGAVEASTLLDVWCFGGGEVEVGGGRNVRCLVAS